MKILLVDDHPMFVEGMRPLLHEVAPDIELFVANSCESALEHLIAQQDFALALLDLELPDMHGSVALQSWLTRFPLLPVVILSASDRQSDMQRALDAGAMGFIPKSSPAAVIVHAIRLVLAGSTFVPKEMITGLATVPQNGNLPPALPRGRETKSLTPRQTEVLSLIIDGHSNKIIARQLGCSEATVKAHVTGVLKALRVANRTQAARVAERLGLVAPK